ncbi:unnamed protein product, partial [Chrysoparadoxa australica]
MTHQRAATIAIAGSKHRKQHSAFIRAIQELPCLYRVRDRYIQRVPARACSLSSKCSYLLVVDAAKDKERRVISWSGRESARVDSVLAKRIAEQVLSQDLQSVLGQTIHLRQEDQAECSAAKEFWEGLQCNCADPGMLTPKEHIHKCCRSNWDRTKDVKPTLLYALKYSKGGWLGIGEGWSWEQTAEVEGKQLSYESFNAEGAFLLACPYGEFHLWLGSNVSREAAKQARILAKEKVA